MGSGWELLKPVLAVLGSRSFPQWLYPPPHGVQRCAYKGNTSWSGVEGTEVWEPVWSAAQEEVSGLAFSFYSSLWDVVMHIYL